MRTAYLFIVAIFSSLIIYSQSGSKVDIILKLNGDEVSGKVTEINESDIKFIHDGETLVYTIKKQDILKITFSSGRIEFFNKPALPSEGGNNSQNAGSSKSSGLAEHHNKVAILPFHYLIDKRSAGEEMTFKVQNEAFAFLSKHKGELEIQDPTTTNALLIKAGVNDNNVRGFTMGELCNKLGVEYLVQGTISQEKTSTTSYSSSSTSYKNNTNTNSNTGKVLGSIFNSSGSSRSSSSSSSTQHYQTGMTMSVYNDKGTSIFSQSHNSIWDSNDAYKVTLQFLLKRTPLYRK